MSAREIDVDGVRFEFEEPVVACKFDELSEYKKMAGTYAIKACDLVVIDGDKLWLVEVKDYDHTERREAEPDPEDLAEIVGQKAHGTMGVLYQLQRFDDRGSVGCKLAREAAGTTEIHVVLHIEPKRRKPKKETDAVLPPYKQFLKKQKTRGMLKVKSVHVGSNFSPVAEAPWTARRDPGTRLR